MLNRSPRRFAYSRTDVDGGSRIAMKLESPQKESWQNYQDLMVLAFPTPEGDTGTPLQVSKVTSDDEPQKWLDCLNGTLQGQISLKPTTGQQTTRQ